MNMFMLDLFRSFQKLIEMVSKTFIFYIYVYIYIIYLYFFTLITNTYFTPAIF